MTEPAENERDTRAITNEEAARRPYVRPARPHRTVGAVDDLAADDAESDYSHDSEFTVGSHSPLPGRAYRRSRNEMPQLKHDLQYGQYLSVPKGRKDIFVHNGRRRRMRTVITVVVVLALLAIAAAAAWKLTGH